MTRRPILRVRSAAGIVTLPGWQALGAFAVAPIAAGGLLVLALAVMP